MANKDFNLVSIITPSYNSAKFISRTIKSVQNQTYSNWEMIIIDDFSSDNSCEIIEQFIIDDDRIHLIKLDTNKGAAIARNEGIRLARGKYIAFLDSDDLWYIDKLRIQIDEMELNKLNFTFTDYYLTNEQNNSLIPFNSLLTEVFYDDIIKFNYIACSTVVFNQEALGKNFMPNIRNRQDWGLWINLIRLNKTAINIRKYLMYYMVRVDSISDNKFKMVKYHWYIYNSFLGFKFGKSIFYLLRNILFHMNNKRR